MEEERIKRNILEERIKRNIKMQEIIFIIIMVIIIILCLSLSILIVSRGNNYGSCSYCKITFKQTEAFGKPLDPPKIYVYQAEDLYKNLTKDICLIKWDYSNGYYEP